MLYAFDDFTLDTQRYELGRAGKRVAIEPKAFDVLAYLIEHRDRVVARHELLEQVWPGQFISDASLTSRLRVVRQAIGDSGRAQRCIQTLHGRGYRFVAAVEARRHGPPEHPPPSAPFTPDASMAPARDHDSTTAPHVEPAAGEASHTPPHAVAGEYKPVTVLVCTLADAQGLAGRLGPEAMHRVMQTFVALALEELQRYGGTLHRQLDDGVVVLFGAPVAHEDHALRALEMAIALQECLRQPHAEGVLPSTGGLSVCMGLHTGPVIVGSLGADGPLTVTPVGDTIRQAVDLQHLAAPDTILLSASTAQRVQDDVRLEEAGPLFHSGKSTELPVYRVRGVSPRQAPLAARVLTQFVGRGQELAALHRLLAQVEGGRGQVVGIVGDPGLGKSRLVYEFRRRRRGTPVTYLTGRCLSYGGATPYLPIRDLLRDACGITEADSPEAATVKISQHLQDLEIDPEDSMPYLLQLLGITAGTESLITLSPEMLKARTFATLRQLSLSSCQQRPLIIEVENLHWIDPTSEEYLAALVEGLAGVSLLLLVTYRPGYRPPWIDRSYATQLVLQPLAAADSRTVVHAVCGTARVPEALIQTILDKAEGNPFFLEELARTVVEQGQGDDARPLLPDTVQAVLAARIDRLPPEAKQLLQVAAVIGKDVPVPLLQAVAEVTEAGLEDGLRRLQTAELLYETRRVPEPAYTFKHALTQEVAYASLLHERRRRLHARIVEMLEALAAELLAEQLERLAYHAYRGEVWDKALLYLRQAGARATGQSAYREAAACFERALDVLAHLPEHRDRREQAIDLRFNLRTVLYPLGEFGRVLDHLREAERLAAALGDARRLAWVSAYVAHHFCTIGDQERALETGHRTLAAATTLADVELQFRAQLTLGMAYHALGNYRQAQHLLEKNVASMTEKLTPESPTIVAVRTVASATWLVWCLAERGEFAAGERLGDKAVQIAAAIKQPYSMAHADFGLGFLFLHKGELRKATVLLERGLALCRAVDMPNVFFVMAAHLGYAYALRGRLAEALPLLEQAVARGEYLRGVGHSLWVAWLSEAYLLAGRRDEACTPCRRALELARTHKERGRQAYALRLLGDIAASGNASAFAQAEVHYQQALVLADELGLRPLAAHCHRGLGRLYGRSARLQQARAALSTATGLYREMGMTFWLPPAQPT